MPNTLQSPRSEKLLTLLLALALLPSCSREPGPSASGPQAITAALADAPASPATPPSPQPDPAPPAPAPIEEGVRLILATEKPEPTTTFELRFDSPVASPDQVGEPATESPLRIEPPLKGTWTWLSTRSGVFAPEEPLRMAQRYTLSLAPLKSPDGAPVAARLTRQIQTPGLEVLTRPSQAETNATARPQFAIHFNADVDPAAIAPFVAFADADGRTATAALAPFSSYYSLAGYYADSPAFAPWHLRFPGAHGPADEPTFSPDGRIPVPNAIRIQSQSPLPPGKGWRLLLKRGLPAAGGAATLAHDAIFPIGDIQPLRVASVETSSVIGPRRSIHVQFNKPIGYARKDDLAKVVALDPAPPDLTLASDYNSIAIGGTFAPGTEYAIRIAAGLCATDGTPLDAGHAARVRFSPVPPRLYFPEVHSWQQARGLRRIDFLSVNLPRVQARAHKIAPSAAAEAFAHFGKAYVRSYDEPDWNDLEPYRPADITTGAFAAMRKAGTLTTVWEQDLDTSAPADETKRTSLDWDEILGKGKPGIVLLELKAQANGKTLGAQTLVQISDIGAVLKRAGGAWHAWAFSNHGGTPLAGATVAAANQSAKTAKDGTAQLPAADPAVPLRITSGADAAAFEAFRGEGDLPPWGFDIPVDYGAAERPNTPLRIFVFGDRLVYQPGETLHLKIIARALDEKGLSMPGAGKAHIRILDKHGRAFFDQDAPIGKTGSAAVSVPIPADVLGHCNAHVEIGDSSEWHYFQVAHYQPDAFEVKIAGVAAFGPSDPISLPLTCRYYFGKPLSGARVKWNASGNDGYFAPEGFDRFSFLDAACAYDLQPDAQTSTEEGELTLGPDGMVPLRLEAPLNASRPVPREFRALVEVTDINQQTVSDAVSFTRHSSEFYLGLNDPDRAARAGTPIPIEMIAVNADGTPRPQPVTATARFSRIEWVTRNVETAGHARTYDREPKITRLSESQITSGKVRRSGASWRWVPDPGPKATVTPDRPGTYLIEVEATDPTGRAVRTARTFNAFGEGEADWDYRDAARIDLEPDQEEYHPGDTASVLVKTPIAGTALVSIEREKVMRTFVTEISRAQSAIRVPLLPGDAPNVFVSVILVRGAEHSPRETPAPEHRFGYCQLKVGNPQTHLQVAVRPASDTYIPGAEITLEGTVSDASAKPVPGAEVTLYAVDEGVLALMGYATPDPHGFFYSPRPLGVESWLSLRTLLPEDPAKRSYINKGFIVGDGGDFEDTLRRKMLACAFWNASLVTDKRGQINAKFPAPDSLTRYRVIAVATADSGRFGSAESAFRIRKPLMLQPAAPAFARTGDRLKVRAVIQNETGADGQFEVSLEPDAKAIADSTADPLRQTVAIPAGGTAGVDFAVRFSGEGTSRWAWRAKALQADASDAVETTIEVRQPIEPIRLVQSTRLTGGAANLLAGIDPVAIEGRGTLRVTIANSPLAELAGATDHLIQYPYGCAEQTASALLPLVALLDSTEMIPGLKGRQAELERMARAGITRLLNLQTPSGGLSYWPGARDPNPWASAYGAAILAVARRSGQDVPQEALARLHEFIRSSMANTAQLRGDASLGPRCLAAWALAIGGAAEPSYHQILFEKRAELSPENRALLAMAIVEANGPEAMARELATSAAAGERVASLWFDDPARDTAMRLLACALTGAPPATITPLLEKLLDLQQNGDWRTTQGNAWAIFSLAEFTRLSGLGNPAASGSLSRAGTTTLNFHLPASGGFTESSLDLPWSGPLELTLAARDHASVFARVTIESQPEKASHARQDRGFSISRAYQKVLDDGSLAPADDLRLGDRILVTLEIQSPRSAAYAAIEDPLPCVLEAVNPDFKSRETAGPTQAHTNFWADYREMRGDKIVWFRDQLRPGTWRIAYLARARAVGTATAPPARIAEMYRPERLGTSDAQTLTVAPGP